MPLFWGDYLRDTSHLTTEQHGAYLLLIGHCWQHGAIPDSEEGCAAVTRLSVRRWRKMLPVVMQFFRQDGTHKRILTEIENTERKIMQRRLAGQKGGYKSGITRAIKAAERHRSNEAKHEANGKQNTTRGVLRENEALANHPHKKEINLSSETNGLAQKRGSSPAADVEARASRASVALEGVMRSKGWSQ